MCVIKNDRQAAKSVTQTGIPKDVGDPTYKK
jgi:hypothetical protein